MVNLRDGALLLGLYLEVELFLKKNEHQVSPNPFPSYNRRHQGAHESKVVQVKIKERKGDTNFLETNSLKGDNSGK